MENDPSGLNIPEILRFRMLWKCYDMKEFGLYRYNMFQEKGHWFPGNFPTSENLKMIDLSRCPKDIPIVRLIKETHRELYRAKKKQKYLPSLLMRIFNFTKKIKWIYKLEN
jgi:predicted aldo/keto reductase-like oxidoreductase